MKPAQEIQKSRAEMEDEISRCVADAIQQFNYETGAVCTAIRIDIQAVETTVVNEPASLTHGYTSISTEIEMPRTSKVTRE